MIMADVVLVFPRSSFLDKSMVHQYPPLGLLSIAVFVEKEFSVRIIDQRIEPDWKRKLLRELSNGPLCVGITSTTGEQIKHALEISRMVKDESEIPVVWGGVHASILPQQTISDPNIDFLIEGEGENSFYNLVRSLSGRGSLRDVRGLWYKEEGKIRKNPPAPPVDISKLPDLPYHILDMEKYILRFDGRRMFAMETSRGCTYNCSFCYVQTYEHSKRWRAISAESILTRIKRLKDDFHIDGVEFQDLNSFIDMKRMERFSQGLIDEKLDVFWNTCGRVNDVIRMDRQYLSLLEKSNMKRFAIGVESGSDRVLDMISKGITSRQVLDAAKKLSMTGIPPLYSFIAGFPGEKGSELDMTKALILKLLDQNPLAKVSILHCYRPLPGNKLFDMAVEHGLKAPQDLEGWSEYGIDMADFPWLSDEEQERIRSLNFLSLFIDRKYEEIDNPFVKAFAKVYKPLARYRFEREDFRLFVEPRLKEMYIRF